MKQTARKSILHFLERTSFIMEKMKENFMKLGLSVYPEQESKEQIEAYLKMGAKYGFDYLFTSIFSVDETKEEIIQYFQGLTKIAHDLGAILWMAMSI